jgi:peptidoglycan/xylan/chitin deacetylase (PgdA/CDA1 family)
MKRNGIGLIDAVGVTTVARRFQRHRTAILTYHGVLSDNDAPVDILNHNFVSATAFEAQLAYISARYNPIALRDLMQHHARGSSPPSGSIIVTFDDGFANNYSVAYPLLRKYGVPFVVFVTTGLVDRPGMQLWTERVKRAIYLYPEASIVLNILGEGTRVDLGSPEKKTIVARRAVALMKRLPLAERDIELARIEQVCGRPPVGPEERERYEFLTWHQIRAMAAAGVEFGSHTVTHPILSALDAPRLERELVESKTRLEQEISRECYAFAYPNGSSADYGGREKAALRAAGYQCAVSLRGTLNGAAPDLFELDRININRHHDMPMFRAAITGLLTEVRRVRHQLGPTRFSRTDGERTLQ